MEYPTLVRFGSVLVAALFALAGCSDGSDSPAEQAEENIGFEILEIQSPSSIRAWISPEINREQFAALEVPQGWLKNQPRESAECGPDAGRFTRSPDATTEGDIQQQEHFGFNWFHAATVVRTGIALDDQGLLSGAEVRKFHELTYNAGSCMVLLISPEGQVYFRIGRDADRVSDQPTIPNLWRLEDYITPDTLVIELFERNLVIRTDNEDSFQGPIVIPGFEPPVIALPPADPDPEPVAGPLYNLRYCEILLFSIDSDVVQADVYNTMGLNDCPQQQWEAIDLAAVALENNAERAAANGPRYWVLDSITPLANDDATPVPGLGSIVSFGEVDMRLAASVEVAATAAGESQPYAVNEVQRSTVFTYVAGRRIYELTDPDGGRYVMQSMSQIVDPDQQIDELASLGERLMLPDGWAFNSRVLDEALELRAEGLARVITDDLTNTYQQAQ